MAGRIGELTTELTFQGYPVQGDAVRSRLMVVAWMALSLTAGAANSKKPPASHHLDLAGTAEEAQEFDENSRAIPPSLCDPCLFYGGDINPNDPNAAGFTDENTLLILGGASTYGAVHIPVTSSVYGILFNVQASAAFDPTTASYDIRTGVSEGNGGTSIASGTGVTLVQATGRNVFGLNEYTVEVSWSEPVTLTPGEYWFNATTVCLNLLDGSCFVFRQLASNSQRINSLHGYWQPNHETYLNSSFYGYTWVNWCDSALQLNPRQCASLSFGLRGSELK